MRVLFSQLHESGGVSGDHGDDNHTQHFSNCLTSACDAYGEILN